MKNKSQKKKPSVHDLVKLINQRNKQHNKEETTIKENTKKENIDTNEKGEIKEENKKSNTYVKEKSNGKKIYNYIYTSKIKEKGRDNEKLNESLCVQSEHTDKYDSTDTESNNKIKSIKYEKESAMNARISFGNEEIKKIKKNPEEESEEIAEKRTEKKKAEDEEKEEEEEEEEEEEKEKEEEANGVDEAYRLGDRRENISEVKLFMIDYKECQNKKCSCKKLYRFKKIKKVQENKKFKGIVLTPFCNKYFSKHDKNIIDTFGISVIDCSWKSVDKLKRVKYANQRKLPYILAVNSINYGKAYKLSCLESLAFCLYICNYIKQCNELLQLYKWGTNFIPLNKELLDAYKMCKDNDAIKQTEEYFQQKYLKEKEENKKEDQYTIVYQKDYIESDKSECS